MKLAQLKLALHELPRAANFGAVQFLTAELAQSEGSLVPDAEYPIWSTHEAHDAAATLAQLF